MHSLGLRVAVQQKEKKGCVYFAVSKINDGIELLESGKLTIPSSMIVPEQLAYIRTNLLSIINKFDIEYAGLRITEGISKTFIPFRLNIEGVVQELFANSSIVNYELLTLVKLAKFLETDTDTVKDIVNGKETLEGFDEDLWSKFNKEEKEAILSSITTLIAQEVSV
ncbi:hypothetical protein [Terribacillus saccharophilus]|uniref:hypothetical protein n=1 Tax=Terribacillus saccharophilus TaxID=361277 RepID=UPI000BA6A94B|nr:hypothetical protein [Terribacillus saccharophilus]